MSDLFRLSSTSNPSLHPLPLPLHLHNHPQFQASPARWPNHLVAKLARRCIGIMSSHLTRSEPPLTQYANSLFKAAKYTDCKVKCGISKKTWMCHKVILSGRSKFFSAAFESRFAVCTTFSSLLSRSPIAPSSTNFRKLAKFASSSCRRRS